MTGRPVPAVLQQLLLARGVAVVAPGRHRPSSRRTRRGRAVRTRSHSAPAGPRRAPADARNGAPETPGSPPGRCGGNRCAYPLDDHAPFRTRASPLRLARSAQELPRLVPPGRCCAAHRVARRSAAGTADRSSSPGCRSRGGPMAVPPAVSDVCAGAAAVGPAVLAAALDASAEATALLDPQGRCVYVNPAACAVLGTPADTLLGRPFPVTAAVDDDRGAPAAPPAGPPRGRRASGTSSTTGGPSPRRTAGGDGRDVPGRHRRPGAAPALHRVRHRRRERRRTPDRCAPPWTRSARSSWGPRTSRVRRSSSSTRPARGCGCTAPRRSTGGRPTSPSGSRTRADAGRGCTRSRRCAPATRWSPAAARRRCWPTRDGRRCTTSSTASPGRTSQPSRSSRTTASSGAQRLLRTGVRARRRRDRLPHGHGRPGRRRGGERPPVAEVRGEAALDERHRLARELHDSACQRLFSMTLHIRAAELTSPPGSTAALLPTLDRLATRLSTTCAP